MNERDLRDPRLSKALQAALSEDHAPDDLVRRALSVPRTAGNARPVPAREPVLPLILPHLCGVLILTGFCIAVALRPEVLANVWPRLDVPTLGSLRSPVFPEASWGWAAVAIPLLLSLVGLEAGRGFRDLRRLGR